jgi:tRNA(Arg) A34 adenosine deaminase TadA
MTRKAKDVTIRTAKKSTFEKFRHGAVIVDGCTIVTSGVNTTKPKTPNSSFSTHAEVWALKRLLTILARKRKTGRYELYVARVTPADNVAFSKPCPKCLKAIQESGVIAVIHYTTDGAWESVKI